jgi:hypothetical protein
MATAEEKGEIFIAQAFLSQAAVVGEVSFLDSTTDVDACKVREALFTQAVNKAPRVDGISFKALRLLWP